MTARLTRPAAATLALVLIFTAVLAAQQPASSLLPSRDSYQDFLSLVKTLKERKQNPNYINADDGDVNLFQALIDAKRDDAVLMLAKAFKEAAPDLDYSYKNVFKSPVAMAYKAKRPELVRKLVDLDPRLVNLQDSGLESGGPVPFAGCVEADDLETLRYFIAKGADLKSGEAVHVKGEVLFVSNLITISPSARMTDFLKKQGLPTVYYLSTARSTACLDDKVRMRKDPSTDAPILAVLAKGEPLSALGYSYAQATIGGTTSRWIFGAFVDMDY